MNVMDLSAVATPAAKPYRLLVSDDQPDVLEALRLLFKGQGWQSVTADSPASLLRAARETGDEFRLGKNAAVSNTGVISQP